MYSCLSGFYLGLVTKEYDLICLFSQILILGDEGTRGDCGYATGISSCPGATAQCSASGVCGASYVCSCNFGFQAGDCSERM